MVVSHIIGGLGNQMFQYAAARSLALQHGTALALDISGFADYALHQGFELSRVFNCSAEIATERDLRNILGWQHSSFVRRQLTRPRLESLRCKGLVVEPHFHYWSGLSEVAPESYLIGYWQSEKYFSNVEPQIRRDFTFRTPMNSINASIAAQIPAVNAVSLHIRRGDYVSDAKAAATHGLCSIDYYQEAIRYISSKTPDPHFFIFSDDIEWAKENLHIDCHHQYINHNHGSESYNDMRLMSMCRHHIIANSSFSWWGAWLNPSSNKLVITPNNWFARNEKTTSDLIPSTWIAI